MQVATNQFDAAAFGRSSADTAFDCFREYGDLETSIGVHHDNVMDTCAEHNADQRDGIDAFDKRVAELRKSV